MQINRIRLVNFRNYEYLDLGGFGPGLNVIYGPNAQGKTNLLEAMYMSANGKSFRFSQERTFIRDGQDRAFVRTFYQDEEHDRVLEMMIGTNKRKSFKKDHQPVKTLREIIGNLLLVSFSPEDIRTAQEGPQLRRSMLDSEISKIRPSYVDALKKYGRIVQEKNKVLKRPDEPGADTLLKVYNEQALPYIQVILKNRRKYIENLNKYVSEVQKEISSGQEEVRLQYRAGLSEEHAAEELEAAVARDKAAFCSVAGPHRDDILITLNGRDVKQYASQGQIRSAMLSIKVACVRALHDVTDKTPILLLDDVFSELDSKRKRNLLGALSGMQVFLTTAEPAEAVLARNIPRIHVEDARAVLQPA